MRVLWCTNIPMPAIDRRLRKETKGSGHWMSSLLEVLKDRRDLELGVATAYPGIADLDFSEDGVRYLTIGQRRFTSALRSSRRDLEHLRRIVDGFRPDLVHVHGTERFFGLLAARRSIEVPCVISIQGLLSAYVPSFFGAMSLKEIIRSHLLREVLTKRGLFWNYREYVKAAAQEEEILAGAGAFLGRTDWDFANVHLRNPGAKYFHVGELLRPEFSRVAWSSAGCARGRIFVTNVGHPRRGVETVLEAAAMLRARGRKIELRFAGNLPERSGYGQFVRRKIAALGLEESVRLLGFLDAGPLARELVESHVYVIASYAENSPNSLCEAMRVGVPCIASYTGGIPSLVQDGTTGLLFPPGDASLLALRLEAVLDDASLASRLGAAARETAAKRHDPREVTSQLMRAYQAVAASSSTRGTGERVA
jgi:glycosyltransferase involved in cell wall biosynthesis